MDRARVMAAIVECRKAANEGHSPDEHRQFFSFDVALHLGVSHEDVWRTIRDLGDERLIPVKAVEPGPEGLQYTLI